MSVTSNRKSVVTLQTDKHPLLLIRFIHDAWNNDPQNKEYGGCTEGKFDALKHRV